MEWLICLTHECRVSQHPVGRSDDGVCSEKRMLLVDPKAPSIIVRGYFDVMTNTLPATDGRPAGRYIRTGDK